MTKPQQLIRKKLQMTAWNLEFSGAESIQMSAWFSFASIQLSPLDYLFKGLS